MRANSEPKRIAAMLSPDQFDAIAGIGMRLGHFTDADLADTPSLLGAAVQYLADADTSLSFSLRWMQRRLHRGEYLSYRDAAHVLNALLAEARRRQYAAAARTGKE